MPRVERSYPPALQAAVDAALAKQDRKERRYAPVPSSAVSGERAKRDTATKPTIRQRRGQMNKTEAEFALLLDFHQRTGEVRWWGFEVTKLRLADGAWYTPDFTVELCRSRLVHYEVKGFHREAAILRLKVAAELHPWAAFFLVKREKGGGFIHTLIGPARGGATS